MKILLIGGTGYLGSHILKSISSNINYEITVFGRSKNIYNKEYEHIHYIYDELENINLIQDIVKNSDIIIHLLSTTVPLTSDLNPINDVKSNLLGTLRLLEMLSKSNIKKIIYISSGGTVYGEPQYLPINEAHPLNPTGSYGIVKVTIEHYIKFYAKKYGFSYVIIRLSNPYGPEQKYDGKQGVISNFLYKTLINQKLSLWGDGNAIRDYIFIDDIVEFFSHLLESECVGTFNLGSGTGVSVNDIIKLIGETTGIKQEVEYKDISVSNIKEVVLDISKIKNELRWHPSTTIEEGICKHYEWLKNEIKINN